MDHVKAHVFRGAAPQTLGLPRGGRRRGPAGRTQIPRLDRTTAIADYAFAKSSRTPAGWWKRILDSAQGRITALRLERRLFHAGPYPNWKPCLSAALTNSATLNARLTGVPLGEYLRDVDAATLLDCSTNAGRPAVPFSTIVPGQDNPPGRAAASCAGNRPK